LKSSQGTLQADTVNLNHFFDVRGVEIENERDFRKINLMMDRKVQIQIPAWYLDSILRG